jgi:hypothetical protein
MFASMKIHNLADHAIGINQTILNNFKLQYFNLQALLCICKFHSSLMNNGLLFISLIKKIKKFFLMKNVKPGILH